MHPRRRDQTAATIAAIHGHLTRARRRHGRCRDHVLTSSIDVPRQSTSARPRDRAPTANAPPAAFARHLRTTRSSAAGPPAAIDERQRLALEDRRDQARRGCRPRTPACRSPSRTSTAPNAKMSVRASASLPSSCSGAMYWRRAEDAALAGQRRLLRRPECRPRRSRPRAIGCELRQAEVEQLHARLRQHHVARLQIAVDDAVPMRLVERLGDLDGDSAGLVERQRAARVSRAASVSPSRYSITR